MRILNFGSLNLDFTYSVSHFVQPGETLSSEKLEIFSGGKGLNQSIALARAGAEVFHAGCIGVDGESLKEQLQNAGVDTRFVKILPDIRTGHAMIQVEKSGQNCILLYGGANRQVTLEFIRQVLDSFDPGDWLLLQNEISGIPEILRIAGEKGMRIALNPSPITEEIPHFPLENVEYFLVNEVEGAALGGKGSPKEMLHSLRQKFPHGKFVLTMGKDGAFYDDGQQTLFQPIFSVKTVDTTAAGDTFTGYFLTAIGEGISPAEALRQAAAASALAVSKMGASPSIPEKKQVEQFLRKQA